MERLKYGATKDMSPEEYKEYKRRLGKRWRDNNPEKVKAQNRYYSEKRRIEKPYICVCKRCGKNFNAQRNFFKICPECQLLPSRTKLFLEERAKRKEKRLQNIEEVKLWYKAGFTQMQIAKDFKVSQKTISNWLNGRK